MAADSHDERYLRAMLQPLEVCASYRPRLGQGRGGYTLEQFQTLYRSDPFYSWVGLDNPLMYAAHKAAGGMTSVYRQIGIGCQALFQLVLRDSLALDATDVVWSYETPRPDGSGNRTLYLDGRIPISKIADAGRRATVEAWMRAAASRLNVADAIADELRGIVFEVRQGYKSKDAKRQNADLANAATAYTRAYLPCVAVFSQQIDHDLVARYRGARWAILTGAVGANDRMTSTYDFMRDVVGYDLAAFFQRNRARLKREIDLVLKALLAAETT